MTFSKITILGHVGAIPELDYSNGGMPICRFTVASNRRWRDNRSGTRMETLIWYRILTFGALAETCFEHLDPGRGIYIEGALDPDPETGGPRIVPSRDGPRTSYEVVAKLAIFLPDRDSGGIDAIRSRRPPVGHQPDGQ